MFCAATNHHHWLKQGFLVVVKSLFVGLAASQQNRQREGREWCSLPACFFALLPAWHHDIMDLVIVVECDCLFCTISGALVLVPNNKEEFFWCYPISSHCKNGYYWAYLKQHRIQTPGGVASKVADDKKGNQPGDDASTLSAGGWGSIHLKLRRSWSESTSWYWHCNNELELEPTSSYHNSGTQMSLTTNGHCQFHL